MKITRSQLRTIIVKTLTEANDGFSRRSFLTGTGIRKNSDSGLLRDIVEDPKTSIEQIEVLIHDPNMDTQTKKLAIQKIKAANREKYRSASPTKALRDQRRKVKEFNDLISDIADAESKGLDTSEKKKLLIKIIYLYLKKRNLQIHSITMRRSIL